MHALVLHGMGDPSRWREAIADLELAIPRYCDDLHAVVHDVALPVPRYLRDFPWDVIVLNSTVLTAVTGVVALARIRERLAFLADSPAFKIALPQDDYYCSEELDALVTDWRCDVVHTVCPEHWGVLYPRFLASGGNLTLGYTGYVTPRMRDLANIAVPREHRRYDVVYRATGRPGFPNGLAMVKSKLGDRFLANFGDRTWRTDISTDSRRMIMGAAWWRFLADSRTTLGSNSGSSVLIRNHGVVARIANYRAEHPDDGYEDVVAACIPAQDQIEFTAVSPRVLEAALVETTQLLVPGPYSGLIEAGVHYWPLRADCSNEDGIVRVLEDRALQTRLAAACKEAVLSTPAIQVEHFLTALTVHAVRHHARPYASRAAFAVVRARHLVDAPARTRAHYLRERLRRDAPQWLMNTYLKAKGTHS